MFVFASQVTHKGLTPVRKSWLSAACLPTWTFQLVIWVASRPLHPYGDCFCVDWQDNPPRFARLSSAAVTFSLLLCGNRTEAKRCHFGKF
jgi:hypothetical protein